jgi:hypothetical protein
LGRRGQVALQDPQQRLLLQQQAAAVQHTAVMALTLMLVTWWQKQQLGLSRSSSRMIRRGRGAAVCIRWLLLQWPRGWAAQASLAAAAQPMQGRTQGWRLQRLLLLQLPRALGPHLLPLLVLLVLRPRSQMLQQRMCTMGQQAHSSSSSCRKQLGVRRCCMCGPRQYLHSLPWRRPVTLPPWQPQ